MTKDDQRAFVDRITVRSAIFSAIDRRGRVGATCDQIAMQFEQPLEYVMARISELSERGWISRSLPASRNRLDVSGVVYVSARHQVNGRVAV